MSSRREGARGGGTKNILGAKFPQACSRRLVLQLQWNFFEESCQQSGNSFT